MMRVPRASRRSITLRIHQGLFALAFAVAALVAPGIAHAAHGSHHGGFGHTGVSALWILANLSYAGMRAQDSASKAWRIVAFIFGFPGTLITFLAVSEGGERAYGVQLPKVATPTPTQEPAP